MVEEIRFNTLEELRSTSESANSLLRSNILVVSAIIAGLSFLYSSNAGTVGDIAQNYGFIFGTGCLLGSIILSM